MPACSWYQHFHAKFPSDNTQMRRNKFQSYFMRLGEIYDRRLIGLCMVWEQSIGVVRIAVVLLATPSCNTFTIGARVLEDHAGKFLWMYSHRLGEAFRKGRMKTVLLGNQALEQWKASPLSQTVAVWVFSANLMWRGAIGFNFNLCVSWFETC